MFSNTDRHNAAIACNKIRAAINKYPWANLDADLSVSMSMGLTDNMGVGSVLEMLKEANQLLKEAKEQGVNLLVYSEKMD